MSGFHDLLRLLRVLTFKRVWNFHLIKWSYFQSGFTKKINHKGLPAFISTEPTTRCNLKCPQCFTTDSKFTRPKGDLTVETFNEIIKQASPTAFYLNLYFQGEPFLHDKLSVFIKTAKLSGFYVSISTNAHFLSAEKIEEVTNTGLDKLIVSVDGADAETYQQYRKGGDFNKVIDGIKLLAETKRIKKITHPYIELQFLVHRKNESQIKLIKQLGKMLGVNKVVLKSFQLINFDQASEWVPNTLSRYKVDSEEKAIIKSKIDNHCFRMWNSCVITWNGDVIPCCFDKNAEHSMGNIHIKDLRVIWESKLYNDFRKKVFNDRNQIGICTNCSE
jgi:radical SAM protein with 4Fe4S-binding SPASM domain